MDCIIEHLRKYKKISMISMKISLIIIKIIDIESHPFRFKLEKDDKGFRLDYMVMQNNSGMEYSSRFNEGKYKKNPNLDCLFNPRKAIL